MKDSNKQDRASPDAYREKIPAFLAGTLDEHSIGALETHLQECETCRSDLQRLSTIWENLPDRAPASAPLDLWPLLQTILEGGRLAAFPAAQPRWRLALSFAAGLLAGLGLWVFGTGGPAVSTAVTDELSEHEVLFEYLDPIPPESITGQYLTLLSIDDLNAGGGR